MHIGWLILLCLGQSAYYIALVRRFAPQRRLPENELREEPPVGLSAAAARYLYFRRFDSDCMIVSLLAASVQNAYFLSWQSDGFSARRNPVFLYTEADEETRYAFGLGNQQLAEHVQVRHTRSRFTDYIEERLQTFLRNSYAQYLFPRWKWLLGWLPIHLLLLAVAPMYWQLLLGAIHAIGWRFLPHYTSEGVLIADAIGQFRLFLVQRVSLQKPLDPSEYYLLPYMVALNVPFTQAEYFKPLLSHE